MATFNGKSGNLSPAQYVYIPEFGEPSPLFRTPPYMLAESET